MTVIKSPKKLIEVALPLDDINTLSSAEKSIRLGHPSNLHLWWARRPFVTARAILFAQLVNDPGGERGWSKGKTKSQAESEREELFGILRELSDFKNSNDTKLLEKARRKILESWKETCHANPAHKWNEDSLPAMHDPFAGGGAIPLEAQRLGLSVHATDINPIPVSINRGLIYYPAKFSNVKPVGPIPPHEKQSFFDQDYCGAAGLAEDVNRYAHLILARAREKLSKFYPEVSLPPEMGNGSATVVSYVWAKTVKSPSPAFSDTHVPLMTNFFLCSKKGKEVWAEIEKNGKDYKFTIKKGTPSDPSSLKKGTKQARGANFECILSGAPITSDYIRDQGLKGQIGIKLISIVALGKKGRFYIEPTKADEDVATNISPIAPPDIDLSTHSQYMGTISYGLTKHSDLYTKRQLLALETFSELIKEVRLDVYKDASSNSEFHQSYGKDSASEYADALVYYLAFALGKLADINNALAAWGHIQECPLHLFTRQAIPMAWDFAEANPIGNSSGSWSIVAKGVQRGLLSIGETATGNTPGNVQQLNATDSNISDVILSCDPPYYDNVPYSDLSDFFYIWERRVLKDVDPVSFGTITTPKEQELVADHKRWGGRDNAQEFFSAGMKMAITQMAKNSHPAFPVTIYYAFKQSDTKNDSTKSTGWEKFLESVIEGGFKITGTWPLRTERAARMRGQGSNALASSIVLVCRKREPNSSSISRRDFQRQLREEMPEALETMIGGQTGQTPIAPVDLAQSAIGPGMAIYSKYEAVLNQDGTRMSVHDALVLINRAITEYLSPDSGNFDADTQFCSSWFEQYGWSHGQFGEADTLARAKGTSVDGVKAAGVTESGGGKVRLLRWNDYESDWDPTKDDRTPVWEACHQMIRRLNNSGESAAGELLAKMPEKGEAIRQLAYHLYTLCERKKWAEEARAYNELIASWHAIVAASHDVGHKGEQTGLDF